MLDGAQFNYKRTYISIKATIGAGKTSSDLIDCGGAQLRRIVLPQNWTDCNMQVSVSEDGMTNLVNTVQNASINSSGVGYSIGDILTVEGGTFTTAAQITVDDNDSSGRISAAHISNGGNYSVFPSNPVSVSNEGSGNGADFNLSPGTTPLNSALQNFDGSLSADLIIPANHGKTIPLYAHWFDSIPYLQLICDETQTEDTYCLLILQPLYQGVHN
jgi:hypothetical protein